MQKVEHYYDILKARVDMEKHISDGWRIHTCSISPSHTKYSAKEKVLVIYEKGGN